MGLLSKPKVVVYKDSENFTEQISKLEELEKEATGKVKDEISAKINCLKAGDNGENEILFQLKYSDIDMLILRDLYIKTGDLSAQIDYLIITHKVNFIIECKNLTGNITINNKGDFIRTLPNGRKIGVPSPITQNDRHMRVIKNAKLDNANAIVKLSINKYFNEYYIPIVALANSKTILNDKYAPKEIKNKIIRADGLLGVIKKYYNASNNSKSSLSEMNKTAEKILKLCSKPDSDYIEYYRSLVAEQKEQANNKTENNDSNDLGLCPRCNSKLVKRNGKKGEFIGCSNFPKCWYTQPLD